MFAQYPLHHVTYAATKFEVPMTNGSGGDNNYKKPHVRTHRQTDKINIDLPFFAKEKSGYNNSLGLIH